MKKWQLRGYDAGGKVAKFYKRVGYQEIYTGVGDWKDWTVHLDGGGRIIEMVTKPLSKSQLAAALHKFSSVLATDVTNTVGLKRLLWDEDNFEKTQPVATSGSEATATSKLNAEAYAEIEANMQYANGASENFAGTIAPAAAQLTTSLTITELKKIRWLWSAMGKPNSDADMKGFLMSYGVRRGSVSKPRDYLVKHAAEFVGPTILETVPDEAKYCTGTKIPDGVFHAKGNKLAQLMTRDGETAYMIEFRGQSQGSGSGIEHDIYEGFRDNGSTAYFLNKLDANFPEA